MTTDRRTLASFLSETSPAAVLRVRALCELEPLCRKADSGFYDVQRCEHCRGCDLRAALECALDEPVAAVDVVSLADATARGPEFLRALEDDVGRTLSQAVAARFGEAITAQLGADGRIRMEDAFWKGVGEPVWHAFEGNRWDALGQAMLLTARGGLLSAASALYGFAVAGDTMNFARLAPLVRALLGVVVLGERKSAPGTWIVIGD